MDLKNSEYPRIPSVVEASDHNLESYPEYSFTRYEVDMARYGKKQQLRVCALLNTSHFLLLISATNFYFRSESLDSCPSLE